MIGRIRRVPLREVWKHEALDLTCWLEQNIDVLNEQIGFELSNVEREKSAGDFAVDLTAEDASGNLVVIENQLEKSNHDHLGKVLTYLSNLEGKTAIWICSEPRPEHVRAISWLNESGAASFYLFKLEAIRIGESEPAPLLTLIVGPSEEGRRIGEVKQELALKNNQYYRFWTGLKELCDSRISYFANTPANRSSWLAGYTSWKGVTYNFAIRLKDAGAVLRLAPTEQTTSDELFDFLYERRNEIDAAFGQPLEWGRHDGRSYSVIHCYITKGGLKDEDKWPEIQEAMVDTMERLVNAIDPHLQAFWAGR